MSEQKKPILWSFDRQTEIDHVHQYTRNQKYLPLCYDVIDAALEIRASGELKPAHVRAFVRAMECARKAPEIVWSSGGKRLVQCTHHFQLARDALVQLSKHVTPYVRERTISILRYGPPVELMLSILRQSLMDSEASVRSWAVNGCLSEEGRQLVPDLEAHLIAESDEKVREELLFAIPLLKGEAIVKDGCETRLMPDGSIVESPIRKDDQQA